MQIADEQKQIRNSSISSFPQYISDKYQIQENTQINIQEKHSDDLLYLQGKKFFLNVFNNTISSQTPSLLQNFILLLQIGHLCTIQYSFMKLLLLYTFEITFIKFIYFLFQINENNKVHLYAGIVMFSLGYIGVFIMTLLNNYRVQRYKDIWKVLFYLTVFIQIFNVLYYIFLILLVQKSENLSLGFLTFDLVGISLYYYAIRQSIIKHYLQDWLIIIMILESVIFTIVDPELFNYGTAQIVFILITLYLSIFIIPSHKNDKLKQRQKNTKINTKLMSFDQTNRDFMIHNQLFVPKNKDYVTKNGVYTTQNGTLTQKNGIYLIKNCKYADADIQYLQEMDTSIKKKNNQVKQKYCNTIDGFHKQSFDQDVIFVRKNSQSNKQLISQFGVSHFSQQSLSVSLDGSHNCLQTMRQQEQNVGSEITIQKNSNQTPLFNEQQNALSSKNSNQQQTNSYQMSSLDISQQNKYIVNVNKNNDVNKTNNFKSSISNNGNKINNITFSQYKNEQNGIINTQFIDSPQYQSFSLLNSPNLINVFKVESNQTNSKKQNRQQNKDSGISKFITNEPLSSNPLSKQKSPKNASSSNKKLQISKNAFVQQIQQVPIPDTYPIICLDENMQIIHFTSNLVEQISKSSYVIESLDQSNNMFIKSNDKSNPSFEKRRQSLNHYELSQDQIAGDSSCNILSQLNIQETNSKLLNNPLLQLKKDRSSIIAKNQYQKTLQELQQVIDNTYCQIVEFYETSKKHELISIFLNHDIQEYRSESQKAVNTPMEHGEKSVTSKKIYSPEQKQQVQQSSTQCENIQLKNQVSFRDELAKNTPKSPPLNTRNSFSFINSPALQGYKRTAMQNLSSNPQFAVNVNSNSSICMIKNSINDVQVIDDIQTPTKKTNQLLITKDLIKPETSKDDAKNNIQTLNHIPQEFNVEDPQNNKGRLKRSSPTKLSFIQNQQSQPYQRILNQQQNRKFSVNQQNRQVVSNSLNSGASNSQNLIPTISSFKADNFYKQSEEYVQNIYQFEKPCIQNSLKTIIQTILRLERDNNEKQVIYRIMKSSHIQFAPECSICEMLKNKNKKETQNTKQSTSTKNQGIFFHRKMSDNYFCHVNRYNLENFSIDIIVNPMKNEKILSPSKNLQISNLYSFQKQLQILFQILFIYLNQISFFFTLSLPQKKPDQMHKKINIVFKSNLFFIQSEKVRLVFRKDFSASFFENVYFIHSLQEEQNRSKADVLLVKKLFIDSFQSVSHEFGTALNCINNLADVAQYSMQENEVQNIIKPIRYNSTLIQFLIQDILDHHMILQNTFILQVDQFSLKQLKYEMLEFFKLTVEYKKLSFEIMIDPLLPDIIIQDKSRIQSILITMIRNAIKYTQKGQIIVELKLNELKSNLVAAQKNEFGLNNNPGYNHKIFQLTINVCDTGVGLNELETKRLKHLLNYGFCGEQVSKNSLGNGIGGLCVSNLIAIKLSGRKNCGIQFEKNERTQSGTIFKFYVESSAFFKTNMGTKIIHTNQQNLYSESVNRLPTIQDDTINYEKNMYDSSFMHNVPSSSRYTDFNSIPRVNSPLELPYQKTLIFNTNVTQQTNNLNSPPIINQQYQKLNSTQNQSCTSSQNLKNHFHMTNSFNNNLNQPSLNQHFSTIPAINSFIATPIVTQQQNNNGAVPNSLTSSMNNTNQQNKISSQYFEIYNNEDFQVENLRNTMFYLRNGAASGSTHLLNEQEEESQNGTPQNLIKESVSPLQIICGKKSFFNQLPRTQRHHQTYNEQSVQFQQLPLSMNASVKVQISNQSQQTNFKHNYTQQTQIFNSQHLIQRQFSINSELPPLKIDSNSSQNQESLFPKLNHEYSSKLDSRRPKISLNINKSGKITETPLFYQPGQFFPSNQQFELNDELNEEKSSSGDQRNKKTSSIIKQSNASIHTQNTLNRFTRMTFGAQSERSDEEQNFNQNKEKQIINSESNQTTPVSKSVNDKNQYVYLSYVENNKTKKQQISSDNLNENILKFDGSANISSELKDNNLQYQFKNNTFCMNDNQSFSNTNNNLNMSLNNNCYTLTNNLSQATKVNLQLHSQNNNSSEAQKSNSSSNINSPQKNIIAYFKNNTSIKLSSPNTKNNDYSIQQGENQNTQEIKEETDSRMDHSTEVGFNKNNFSKAEEEDNDDEDDEIADERLGCDKKQIVEVKTTFNDKWETKNKLSGSCCVKILFVDDEPFNHFVMKQILKSRSLNCDTALNGEDGLQKFMERKKCLSCGLNSYCLIFMDLNMPVKNGFEATYDIKQYAKQSFWNKVTVITCSAFIDISSKMKAQQSGSDYFIQKPINQKILFDLLESLFKF